MSLLMDALKRAEQAKRQADELPAQDADLAPVEPEPALSTSEPEPSLELEAAEALAPPAARVAPAAPAEAPRAAAEVERERAQAQQVFAAKPPPSRKGFYWTLAGLATLAAAGIGGWVWWQIQPKSGLAGPGLAARPAAGPAAGPIAAPTPAPAPAAAATADAARSAGAPPAQPESTPRALAPQAAKRVPAPRSDQPTRDKLATDAAQAAGPDIPIRVGRPTLSVHPQVSQGYERYLAGDAAGARRAYGEALRAEPRNRDALHGMAAIAIREGRPELAETYYRRALEADPNDAAALAGLAALRADADPVSAESRLKTLATSQPDAPPAQFALGNVFAGQSRWGEAQQAYFKAYSGDPENPDYLHNLAVSLDQLRQPKLALRFYREALLAAEKRPAAFDGAQVAARVGQLEK